MTNTQKGQRLRELRKRMGKTQREMSELLGMNQGQYSKTEAGILDIPVKYLDRLQEITGVDLNWILTGSGVIQEEGVGYKTRDISVTEVPIYQGPDRLHQKGKMAIPWASPKAFILENMDRSMEPDIRKSDQMILEEADLKYLKIGEIHLIRVGDSWILRRIKGLHDGILDLVSDREGVPPLEIPLEKIIQAFQVMMIFRTNV